MSTYLSTKYLLSELKRELDPSDKTVLIYRDSVPSPHSAIIIIIGDTKRVFRIDQVNDLFPLHIDAEEFIKDYVDRGWEPPEFYHVTGANLSETLFDLREYEI